MVHGHRGHMRDPHRRCQRYPLGEGSRATGLHRVGFKAVPIKGKILKEAGDRVQDLVATDTIRILSGGVTIGVLHIS